ncbi:DUF4232 domain-containing protein [Streptomyces sp. NBC_00825]|uniref:DUF4232 domain-containing protein n=1 Tax=unclassified Streptomyces TaxID=2593676 RepID=UPI0022567324|nr:MULTISPECIES: DUF4232 domain-containing protein [unclassified Streptomyces]WTB54956.1 DUF4232 domain-containing protein [Streptomyces sp. NBC_00826]WTH92159.1 DUF4232 domain-containing protein [Streptomyces sp. NBC_00825]WTI00888.1 DUF4232 domain-containing protein [Streptomyces sp. NBC_00822]MCX4866422.1 DUF4232 domain-containing protein [Streptomyces sp. NBC_00906]MCX4897660.1 DUF4232 domain-containing protein [Streptomyces sp. NBC_00892]
MRVRKLTFAALAVAAGLSLTACQNGEDDLGQSAPPSASGAASASGGSGSGGSGSGGAEQGGGKGSSGADSGGQGTAAGSGSDVNSKVGKCRTDELEITASDSTIGGDTEGTVAVELKNGGGRDCLLSGYAGVDLKTSAGSLSAVRTGEKSTPMTLKDGKSVYFGISYPVNDSGGSGVRVTGLVVTPPDETKAVTLDWPGAASLPVTDGSGSQVKVGPMGSAGQGEG